MTKKSKNTKIKFIIIVTIIIGLILVASWYLPRYFTPESLLSEQRIVINNKTRIIKFSEKSSGFDRLGQDLENKSETSHYGYFLELKDSTGEQSLDKIKFESPVWIIQKTPEMIVLPDGRIWIVSITNSLESDEPGFILKYDCSSDKLVEIPLKWDNTYHLRKVSDTCVFLGEVNRLYQGYFNMKGGIYFHFEKEKLIDSRTNF